MVSPLTLLRTIRHLSPRQAMHQAVHRLVGPAQQPAEAAVHGCTGLTIDGAWEPPSPEGEPIDGGQRVALFGRAPHDPQQSGWQPERADPLWLYTLHYHGWINHPSADPLVIRALLLGWIDNHPRGVGWEPYPTAMRILHWIAWLARHQGLLGGNQRRWLLGSLAAQLAHLESHLERRLGGNHLFTDLCALVTAGLTLDGPLPLRLADRWLSALVHEVRLQIADDGGHRERTPTYHCLLAEQLAGVCAALALRPHGEPAGAVALSDALTRMLEVLPAFTHPDGDVALWGDSQRRAPVTPTGLLHRFGRRPLAGDADAPATGLFRREWGPWTVLWNAGGVGLDHQVGHIHADALAFELSLGRERVLVDAGVGTYQEGPERAYCRGTRAHSTVTLGPDDPDQHELWASHRIGGRAVVQRGATEPNRLIGEVRGYQWPARHRRVLEWTGGRLRCSDAVSDPAIPATARFYFPAGAAISRCPGGHRVHTAAGARFTVLGADTLAWEVEPAAGWLAIGAPSPRTCLAVRLPASGLTVDFIAEP
jgi:hypothetical protein